MPMACNLRADHGGPARPIPAIIRELLAFYQADRQRAENLFGLGVAHAGQGELKTGCCLGGSECYYRRSFV